MNFFRTFFSGFQDSSKSKMNESYMINDHIHLSTNFANELFNDRVKFKLYAAQHHLNILKEYKKVD